MIATAQTALHSRFAICCSKGLQKWAADIHDFGIGDMH